jgi:hypothetical protein
MKIFEVIELVERPERGDDFRDTSAAYNQRVQKGQDTQKADIGKDTGHARNTGVDYVDQVNQKKADTRSGAEKQQDADKEFQKKLKALDIQPGAQPDSKSSADLRRARTTSALRGRGRRSSGDDGDLKTGSDGRKLKHDRYYQDDQLGDYDSVLPTLGIKKGVDTAKKYAANFVRDPAKTMANLRYKFKDLLQK